MSNIPTEFLSNIKSFIHSNPKLKKIIDNIYSKENLPEIKHIKNGEEICVYNKDDVDYFDKFNESNYEFLLFIIDISDLF